MSEPGRPKPEYGEYASDEEYSSALERSGVDPTSAETQVPFLNYSVSDPRTHAQSVLQSVPVRASRRHSSLDRIVTLFLLSFGVVSIIGGASNYLNLSETLQETVKQIGMGEYHSTELTAGFGIAILVSQVVLWIIAAVWSYRRILSHKYSWWVPVLAGALSFIVLTALLGSMLATDPSFIPLLSKL